MKKTRMFACGMTLWISASALADTRLEIHGSKPGKSPETLAVMVTGGKARMETSSGDGSVILFHRADKLFYAIQPREKSYLVLDPEKAGAMLDQASRMQQQMMAQLEEQTAGMSEAQREQMKAMMSRMGKQMPQRQEESVRYQARGDSGSAAGIACRWYEAYRGSQKVRELCLAAPDAIGLPPLDAATLKAMQSSMKALASRLGDAGMFQDDLPEGMPIHVRHFDGNGRLTSEQEVASVSHDVLDPSLFEVPAGYERQEMPSLPR